MKLRFERIENYNDGYGFECPVVKVTNPATGRYGYLEPFRWYSMQISGSIDGDMDLGSSVPKPFKYIVNLEGELLKSLLHCINAHLDNNYGWTGEKCVYTYEGKPETYKIHKDLYYGKCPNYNEYVQYPIENEDWVEEFIKETVRCFRKYYNLENNVG
jgi:hypothetical protein